MSTNNTILGLLSGLAIGAIAGILLAPDSGENTRAKIKDKSKEAKDGLTENLNDLLENMSEKYDVVKKAGSEIVSTSKAELSKVKREVGS